MGLIGLIRYVMKTRCGFGGGWNGALQVGVRVVVLVKFLLLLLLLLWCLGFGSGVVALEDQ
jgi:hypothetical protein